MRSGQNAGVSEGNLSRERDAAQEGGATSDDSTHDVIGRRVVVRGTDGGGELVGDIPDTQRVVNGWNEGVNTRADRDQRCKSQGLGHGGR